MVEVPAAISQLPFWKKKIYFISIGSNDLSQYLLALDRNNARVANRYDHAHPAVLHEVYRIVTIAKQCQLPVSLCGEMAADPVAVLLLLGMGIRRLSMSSSKLPRIKWLIRSIPLTAAQQFLAVALTLDNVVDIRTEGRRILVAHGLDELT
jgi:phosphotransferase system enzyme I (PtsI)/phosphotransferase system enzyme I (PtsP)